MACERYREALTGLAAGGLASDGLEAHLAGCEDCRLELAALRRALDAVDADLRELVATEPSPALAVHIRQAAAEVGAGWRPAFTLQALAAAAVLAALTFVLLRGHETGPSPVAALTPPSPAASGTPLPAAVALPAATARPAASPRPREQRVPSTASTRRAAAHEPEVLVPPGEGEALLRLVALVNRQRVAPPGLRAAGQASPDLAEPPAIDVRSVDIKPLEIVPLDAAETPGT